MKNSCRRLILATAAFSAIASAAPAQDPAPITPATSTAPGTYGINIPPQNFSAPSARPTTDWSRPIDNITPIAPARPREIEQSAINIGPISVRESGSDRRRAGCRWTVRDESLQRRCRF